ncbi:MAG: NAD(P)/FAD-dependent oxidoreductase [Bacteroidota bacterium]
MNRKAFLKNCLAAGIGLPFANLMLNSCEDSEGIEFPMLETDFSGKVLIVGAGAAGLSAGYLLNRLGIDFEIVEASSRYGGRLKHDNSFADFPIDLGAEWIHESPSVLTDILNNPQIDADLDIIVYNPQEIKTYNEGNLSNLNVGSNFYSEYKFKSTTWFSFFERFIIPEVQDRIVLNAPIARIDHSGDRIVASTETGTTFEGDRVLITVPVNILQDELIDFIPSLPLEKTEAINSIFMGDGIKVFMEFSERFYPDIVLFGNLFDVIAGTRNKLFYDAAFRKETDKNILGLFAVQTEASTYTDLGSDADIISFVLSELDEIFDGRASQSYIKHVIQNWSSEPYIRGSYSDSFDGDTESIMNTILEPINNKIYFAGEALTFENQSTVHGACESAYKAIEKMMAL